jgi:hypothetical protein
MRALTRTPLTAVAAAAAVLFSAGAADAACKKMGFLVNDYGKDGPSKDAQDLLDKHVAEWAAQNGIKNYTIGKKDVKCELYIDVLLFDEHTCTASANVCWDEPGKEKPAKSAKKKSDEPEAKSAENDEKKSSEKQPAASEEKPAETASEKPAAAAIETGAIQSEEAKPAAAPAASSNAAPAASSDDAAARAAAAAERAAEAAERAAAAAERAAAASSKAASPSQLEMPAFGAGKPAEVAPVTPVEPKS